MYNNINKYIDIKYIKINRSSERLFDRQKYNLSSLREAPLIGQHLI